MLLLLIPGIQSRRLYWVCQNIAPVNKWMAKYQSQLNNTRQYSAQLGQAKWVSMLNLKADFHNMPCESTFSYGSTFVIHWGNFWWLRMPMVLM